MGMFRIRFAVGTIIRLIREQKGMNQESLGMKKTSASKIELGQRNPRPETLEKIAVRLGVTVDEIHEYADRLNSLSDMEPVDGNRRRLVGMLDDLLTAGGKWSGTIEMNIESLHKNLADSRKEAAKKEPAA